MKPDLFRIAQKGDKATGNVRIFTERHIFTETYWIIEHHGKFGRLFLNLKTVAIFQLGLWSDGEVYSNGKVLMFYIWHINHKKSFFCTLEIRRQY